MFGIKHWAGNAKDSVIRLAAVFMAVLIVSIPLNVSAYMGSLSNLNHEQVLAGAANLDVSVTATLTENVSINENNLRINYRGSDEKFSSCTGDGPYECRFETGMRDWNPGEYDIEVKLFDNYMILLDSLESSYVVDGLEPDIESMSVSGGRLSFTVRDRACETCSKCSGLDKAIVKVEGEQQEEVALSGCSASQTVELNIGQEGDVEVCLEVSDIMGNFRERCSDEFFDLAGPQIGSLKIYKDGVELKYSSVTPINAQAVVSVSDTASDIATVKAEFRAFGSSGFRNGNCGKSGDALNCSWPVTVTSSPQGAIEVIATDSQGNKESKNFSINLPLDESMPVVTDIVSSFGNGTYLKRSGNTIRMSIDDQGSGMGQGQAFMRVQSPNVKATVCNASWDCYWENVALTGRTNDTILVRVERVIDDAGNGWDKDASVQEAEFILDDQAPVFKNLTIEAYGSGLDIIMEGDIVGITGIIEEKESGIYAAYANLSDLGEGLVEGDCTDQGRFWRCEWQYAGQLKPGDIAVKAYVLDNAGNRQDGPIARATIMGVIDKEVDYWSGTEAIENGKINRNFLWMSNSGSFVRVGARLVANGQQPTVYGIDVISCQGNLSDTLENYNIKQDYYGASKSEKYLILEVPNYKKETVGAASSISVYCEAEVIQGQGKKVYQPNEQVNMTFEIALTNPLFSTPDISAIDMITEKKKTLDTIEGWIDSIEFWVDFLRPICSIVSLIRQLLAGVCTLLNAFIAPSYGMTKEAADSCFLKFDLLEKLWYGKQGEALQDGPSSKSILSMGFVCDLVLCEDCGIFWKKYLIGNLAGFDLDSWASSLKTDWLGWSSGTSPNNRELLTPAEKAQGLGTYDPTFTFDPRQSLTVAVVCFPPCLTGILNKLKVYREIIITYNACVNVQMVRGGDVSECDEYWSSQVCQQILGEFWYLIDNFIKDYIVKFAMWAFEEKLLRLSECPEGCTANNVCQGSCLVHEVYRIVGWFLVLADTIDTLEALGDHEWFSKNSEEGQKKAEDHLNEKVS